MTEDHPATPADLRDEACYCSRPDMPHDHKIADHEPRDTRDQRIIRDRK